MALLRAVVFLGFGGVLAEGGQVGIGGSAFISETSAREGVCEGSGYQNLGWSGMSNSKCIERAIESNSAGSCAFLSFAQSYNNGQTGCWCFKADQCQNVKATPNGQDGEWKTWAISSVIGLPTPAPTLVPSATPAPSSLTSAPTRVPVSSLEPSPAPTLAPSAAPALPTSSSNAQAGWCTQGDRSNIAFGGMTRDQCLTEAKKRQDESNGCPLVSYSASSGPQQQNKFCQCIRNCEKDLVASNGEVWETLLVDSMLPGNTPAPPTLSGTTSAANTTSPNPTPAHFLAPTPSPSPSNAQAGWCTQGDRSNIAFGGMTRGQCLSEAKKRQQENNGCPLVSYSASSGPQQQNKFCQCIRSCEVDLLSRDGEVWVTLKVDDDLAVSLAASQVASNVALGVVLVAITSAMY